MMKCVVCAEKMKWKPKSPRNNVTSFGENSKNVTSFGENSRNVTSFGENSRCLVAVTSASPKALVMATKLC